VNNMGRIHTAIVSRAVAVLLLLQPGCFFSGGVSTVSRTTGASGSGFVSATERNGQWDTNGPPPQVGDVTERLVYRKLEKATTFSVGYVGKVYELADPYPSKRYRIAAIREVGTDSESGGTVHYYQVEFDPVTGG
jgi:hypothetical protein